MKINIFTISNNAYFIHLQGLLYSLKALCDIPYQVYIYDIGLTNYQIKTIKNQFNFLPIEIIKSKKKYTHQEILEYKFKVDLWEIMKHTEGYILYHDAKNHQKYKLSKCLELLKNYDILITGSNCLEYLFTHIDCIKYMECEEFNKTYQIQSGLFFFNNIKKGNDLINDMVKYGNIKECLCPDGSNKNMEGGKNTHRQDQSIFSLLVKKHKLNYKLCDFGTYHNTIHQ